MFDIRKIQEHVLFDAIQAESHADLAQEVVYGSAQTEPDPLWVKNAMRRLENRFAPEMVKKIRMRCQCGYAMDEKLALVMALKASAANLETFAGSAEAHAAGLFCQDGALYLQFDACPCPMLAEVDKLDTLSWCQCTAGYSKVLFENAFDCAVDVELLKSIKMGDDRCLMQITLHDPLWQHC